MSGSPTVSREFVIVSAAVAAVKCCSGDRGSAELLDGGLVAVVAGGAVAAAVYGPFLLDRWLACIASASQNWQ
jgi:hypothetical protein